MNGKMMSENSLKPVCSVTEMSRSLELSRARFYQLVQEGVFPFPVYDLRTKRPYYTAELQQICHQVRQTNIGHNGLPALFYSPRQNIADPALSTCKSARKPKAAASDTAFQELMEALRGMGIREISNDQVKQAFSVLHPEKRIEEIDSGVLIRELFRYFRQKGSI